jgi:hypothetical protein
MKSRPSGGADVSPAPARTLLRLSKGFGRDAAQSHQDGLWQRTERAAARGTGRAGHRLDRRNPNRVGVGGRLGAAVVIGALGVVALAVAARRARRARR